MMCSLYDKINVKRIQARFKKYIHAKKCVDMNFLHFVGVWISNAFFWVRRKYLYEYIQMRLTSYKPTQPNPGEDIHHTVISCVGN